MYYNDYGYGSLSSAADTLEVMTIWTIVAFILAVIGGILAYFLFIKGNHKLNNGLSKLRDLLDFKIMLIEPILKIFYLISTIFIILFSFNLITVNFLSFLLVLIFGPLVMRIIYEASLMLVMIWKNTKIISDNTSKEKTDNKKTTKVKDEDEKN